MLTSSRISESFVPYPKLSKAFCMPVAPSHTATFPTRLPANTLTSSCTSHGYRPNKPDVAPQRNYYPESRNTTVSIPHLREALHSLDSTMASLMSQRQELESHLEQAVRLQSPVLRLPSELLSSIFIIGVQETDEGDSLLVSTLMLVCRYWAEVAVGTPVLWSKIEVSKHHSLEKAHRKLARSKSVPVDITINFGPRPEQTTGITESIVHAMDLFRPALWRTKSFRLSVPNRPQAHAVLLRCQEDAPLLEFLSIRIFHSIEEDHHSKHPPLPLFNGHTPRLLSCSFTSFNFGWDPATLSRLSVLKLGGYYNGFSPSVDTLLDILHECPLLQELALRNMSDVDMDLCSPHEAEIHPTRMIRLPRLTKMSFYFAGIMRSRMILDQLFFPALESLELCYLNNVTPILQRMETQALTSLPLRNLRVESCLFNELMLVRLLRRLPSLVTLDLIDNEDVSSNFLRGLSTPPPTQRWVCPKLRSLNLDGCTSLEWDALRNFIESRLPAHPQAYPRQHIIQPPSAASSGKWASTTSASSYARSRAIATSSSMPTTLSGPHRLHSIDVTRCHQISKEMVQWLRMYVADVRCEPAKGVWGEPILP